MRLDGMRLNDSTSLPIQTLERAAATLCAAGALLLASTGASAADAVDLFQPRAALAISSGLSPAAVQATAIDVAVDEVAAARPELRIPSLGGRAAQVARLSDFEYRGAHNVAWRGWIDGRDGARHRVILTAYHGRVAGLVYAGDAAYEIQPLAGGGHALVELDDSRFSGCGAEPGAELESRAYRNAYEEFTESLGADSPIVDPADRIDVMGLYTADARRGAGGAAEIEATVQSAVDVTNTGFIDSDMIARLRLVYTGEVSYTETSDLSNDLDWVSSDAGVAALRDQYAADMVGLVVEDGGNSCGIAYVMQEPSEFWSPFAFQVTDRGCAVGNLSYAHEHGHNLGLEHDPANGSPPNEASYVWSYGHFVDGSYRTIMAYESECTNGCTRVAHFSNPDVDHSGAPTGIDSERDNARSADLTAPIVANFRSGLSLELSGSCPGLLSLSISGAAPNARVMVVKGSGPGSFTVPSGSCAGTRLALSAPRPALTLNADGNGEIRFTGTAPDSICGDVLQLLDLDRCTTSGAESLGALSLSR